MNPQYSNYSSKKDPDFKTKRKMRDYLRRRDEFLFSFDQLSTEEEISDFSKINLDSISQNAGLTKPTFYRYFSSKDDFLIGFAAYAYRQLSRLILQELATKKLIEEQNKKNNDEIIDQIDDQRDLLSIVIAYHRFTSLHPGYVRILNEMGLRNTNSVITHKKIQGNQELTQSEIEYIQEWSNFRKIIQEVLADSTLKNIQTIFPQFSSQDISEIFLLVFNGIITEFKQRNKNLQEKGISEEQILNFIVGLIEEGLKKYI